ncbi:DUF6612 family protein [Paenibacillus nasutitermitis]|uniref:Lipoprotein n=1 Tax=Paenibacillus nasutitermitis TaxID=1652958 RepID=A0A916ZDV5_9BACL|nr:DUF6612 family protein [Paenibacillus nasutitermitis]GGD90777.1 hypothetical protein GCM10010911_56860 [Paenibacillus nasutitermitis]
MKKWTAGLLTAIMVLGITACGSKENNEPDGGTSGTPVNESTNSGKTPDAGTTVKDSGSIPTVDELIQKSTDASIALKSFSMEAKVNQNITMGEGDQKQEQKIDLNMKSDLIKEPLQMYQDIEMKMADGSQSIKQYIMEDGIYSQVDGNWAKLPNEMKDQMIASMANTIKPESQMEQFKSISKDTKVTEEGDHYVMTAELSGDGVKELAKSLMSQAGGGSNEQVAAMMDSMNIKNIKIVYGVDKKTYLPTKSDVAMTMDMDQEGQKVSLDMVMASTISNHNEIKEIKVPQEALDAPSSPQ